MEINVLIAPNAFKNSATATEVAEALEKGLQQSGLHCNTECFPIADGGDGTADLIMQKCKGAVVECKVNDKHRDDKAKIADTIDDKCFVAGVARPGDPRTFKFSVVPETD